MLKLIQDWKTKSQFWLDHFKISALWLKMINWLLTIQSLKSHQMKVKYILVEVSKFQVDFKILSIIFE